MVRIKICGITNLDDALFCLKAGIDALGFIFWPASPRSISVEAARKIIKEIGPFITTVGVFVNESLATIESIVSYTKLRVIQLHGQENQELINKLRYDYFVIKTIFPEMLDNEVLPDADAYLLDIRWEDKLTNNRKCISSEIISNAKNILPKRPLILSGGLNLDNIKEVIAKFCPYGVDIARGVESSAGHKDKEKVKKLISLVRGYNTL